MWYLFMYRLRQMILQHRVACILSIDHGNVSVVSAVWPLSEPGHSISYNIVCAPSEDSDQPAPMRRLIWVFAVAVVGWLVVSLKQADERACFFIFSVSPLSLSFHSIFTIFLFHLSLLLSLLFPFSLSLGDDAKWPTRVDMSVNKHN